MISIKPLYFLTRDEIVKLSDAEVIVGIFNHVKELKTNIEYDKNIEKKLFVDKVVFEYVRLLNERGIRKECEFLFIILRFLTHNKKLYRD